MAVRIELVEGADASAGLVIAAGVIELQVHPRCKVLDRQSVAQHGCAHSSTDVTVTHPAKLPRPFNFEIKIGLGDLTPYTTAEGMSLLPPGGAIEGDTLIVDT